MSLLDTASLIVTPNGYKEGKLYSVIPSDGSGDMSVTRATTATRVNSAGLVELVPYNLLQYSQDFSNAYWLLLNSATITANSTTAPNGTLTADTLNLAASASSCVFQSETLIAGSYTISVYAKTASGTKKFRLRADAPSAVASSDFTATTEWQRFEFTFTSAGGTGCYVINETAGTAGSIYIWGAQLVEGSTAKDYQKTETRLNIPRLDYSNGTCPSLLVEPQRTNRVLYSSSFDNAAWDKINGTMTANATTSPDGNLTAEQWAGDGTNTIHDFYQAFTGGATTTSTIYVKKNTAQFVYISLNRQASGNDWATGVYDLDNLTTATFQSGGVTNQVATITDEGNGWRRITLSVSTTDTALFCMYGIADSLNPTFGPFRGRVVFSSSASFYAWGAQLEAGAYPTSYIPTTSASISRNADVISKTGISSLIGQTEGTMFVDLSDYIELDIPCLTIDNGTNDNRIVLFREAGTGYLSLYLVASGTPVAAVSTTSASDGKIAIAYNGSGFVMYRNGVQILTATSAVPSSMSAVRFNGRATNDFYTTRKIKSFALWKQRLTNTQLAELTTL